MVRTAALGFVLLLTIFGSAAVTWFDGDRQAETAGPLHEVLRRPPEAPRVSAAEVNSTAYPDGFPHITTFSLVERTTETVTYAVGFEDSTADLQRVEWQRPEGAGRMATGAAQVPASAKWKTSGMQYVELPCSPGDIAFIRVSDVRGHRSDWQVARLDCLE